jgi:hypothetical protein
MRTEANHENSRLTVVDTVKKELLYTEEEFGPGELSFFIQRFWVPPFTEIRRHRHPVMNEFFLTESGELEITKQRGLDEPETISIVNSKQMEFAAPDFLHTLRNRSNRVIQGIAIGVILRRNGTTIRE